ncbi:MAG TPA: class III extradiol ring-cleavage dioxygenase [Azospirillaceae bacterium]|nr:class III extradiol ring-cleavage dioxygenase [Azospirillaceae bacterium]
MTISPLPSLFVSHGAPLLALEDAPARRFLQALGDRLPRPSAVLAVSAHWETPGRPTLGTAPTPETIHDFSGFPAPLYHLAYPAPGAPALAERAATLLAEAGRPAAFDSGRGLDHGAWVPLMLIYPDADIPVTQLSIVPDASAEDHLAIGRALAPLRAEGVLILGSGSAVHNLRALDWAGGRPAAWATAFMEWLDGTLSARPVRSEAVAAWLQEAPSARLAHPTDDHFLPLPVALGAAGQDAQGVGLHASWQYGNLGLHTWAFTGQGEPLPIAAP